MNQSKHFAADLSDNRADVQAARRGGTATRHGAEDLSTNATANDACNTVTSDRPRGVEDVVGETKALCRSGSQHATSAQTNLPARIGGISHWAWRLSGQW
jgi:hypothetical protein